VTFYFLDDDDTELGVFWADSGTFGAVKLTESKSEGTADFPLGLLAGKYQSRSPAPSQGPAIRHLPSLRGAARHASGASARSRSGAAGRRLGGTSVHHLDLLPTD
jgi:hypothetical protein